MARERPSLGRAAPRRRRTLLVALGVLGAAFLGGGFFPIDVTEIGIVTRFGRVVGVMTAPGLHWTFPIDEVERLDNRLALLRLPKAEYLTEDKKNLVAAALVSWRVGDPVRFLERVGTREAAQTRLTDVVSGEFGADIGDRSLAELVSADGGRADALHERMLSRVTGVAAEALGIHIAGFSLQEVALPEQNRNSVLERMKAERGRIAKQFRSEGEIEAKRIIAKADRDRLTIDAEGYAEAQRLRAEGDAEAARLYASAFLRDAKFYFFLRSLQAMEKIVGAETTLVLPIEAESLGLLRGALRSDHTAGAPRGNADGGSEARQ